jgi:hypothetical protein
LRVTALSTFSTPRTLLHDLWRAAAEASVLNKTDITLGHLGSDLRIIVSGIIARRDVVEDVQRRDAAAGEHGEVVMKQRLQLSFGERLARGWERGSGGGGGGGGMMVGQWSVQAWD